MMRVIRAGDGFAQAGAGVLADALRDVLQRRERASLALSGGATPWLALCELAKADLDWACIDVYQVDERVAPSGDPARNLGGLASALLSHVPATAYPMPVEAPDLQQAARHYDAMLPETLDVVHLGLGDDGHTASLLPGDPVLDVVDHRVAVTEPYRGHRRMTLTFPALEGAGAIAWLVRRKGKASMVERLLAADPTIPAGCVPQAHAVLVTDGAGQP